MRVWFASHPRVAAVMLVGVFLAGTAVATDTPDETKPPVEVTP